MPDGFFEASVVRAKAPGPAVSATLTRREK
jgi:hypothetical protein